MQQKRTLRELREARRGPDGRPLTREELAVAVGAKYATIVRLDQRKHLPKVDLAVKIARYFGVSVEDIDWSIAAEGKELAA